MLRRGRRSCSPLCPRQSRGSPPFPCISFTPSSPYWPTNFYQTNPSVNRVCALCNPRAPPLLLLPCFQSSSTGDLVDTTSAKSSTIEAPKKSQAPSSLDANTESKPPTGKPPPPSGARVVDYGDYGDYDDFDVAEENFLLKQQKRPLEVPTPVTSAAATGDYSNFEQIKALSIASAETTGKQSPTEKLLPPPTAVEADEQNKQKPRNRDSFGSDYEVPLMPPRRTSGECTINH